MDFEKGEFIFEEFVELNRGFDFYAPQSFVDEKGITILIGWMGLPDIEDFKLSLKSDCVISYCKETKVLRLRLEKSGYGKYERAVSIER